MLVEEEPLLARASSGSSEAISALLQALAEKLLGNADLTTGERAYLAESLLEISSDVIKFGRPFGIQPKEGRPSKLSPHLVLRVGLAIDRMCRPEIYGRNHAPLPLEDNDNRDQDGVYSQVGRQLGVSPTTVRRAYKKFLKRLPNGAPQGLLRAMAGEAISRGTVGSKKA